MAKKKLTKAQKRKIQKKVENVAKKKPVLFYSILIILLVAAVLFGLYYFFYLREDEKKEPAYPVNGETFSLHILEIDNDKAGDSIFIKAGEVDILIDAGSIASSANYIDQYLSEYVTDGKLEYVIATHSDSDHISGFVGTSNVPGIFDRYDIGTLIDFKYVTNETQLYQRYQDKIEERLNSHHLDYHYTADQCVEEKNGAKKEYVLSEGMRMEILSQRYYFESSSDNNNHSVCTLFQVGEVSMLLTGDLEKSGETSLIEQNPGLSKVHFFKAGHHGSPTSSNENLLSVIQPEVIAVSAVAGRSEYTDVQDNTFPSQAFIDRAAKYTDQIYCTREVKYLEGGEESYQSRNGTIVFLSDGKTYQVSGSHDNTILKDSAWFQEYRTWPKEGVSR